MKRSGIVILFIASFLIIGASGAGAADKRFSLVIREGFGALGIGDLNTSLASIDAAYDTGREVNPNYTFGHFREVPGSFKDWELEIRWAVWKGFSIGAALSGPIHLHGYGNISYIFNWTQSYTIESDVRMKAPLKLNLYYSLPVHSNVNLVLNGGVGMYNAHMSQNYDWQRQYHNFDIVEDNYNVAGNYNYDVSGHALGCHFGVAFEYRINSRFSMMVEGQWTLAKIRSLKGTSDYTSRANYVQGGDTIYATSETEEGYLYHYIESIVGEYEELAVFSDPDSVSGISDVQKASLDLGAFTFRIGLKIGLF